MSDVFTSQLAAKRRKELMRLLSHIEQQAYTMRAGIEKTPEYTLTIADDFADLSTLVQAALTELHHYRMLMRHGR